MITVAMIDYGSIAKINGKIVTPTEMFTPMQDTLGFVIEQDSKGNSIEGNYFVFLGDEDLYIGIYKTRITFFSGDKVLKELYSFCVNDDWVNYTKRYRRKLNVNGVDFDIKRLDDGNRFKLRFWYKGNLYETLYGYGVARNINSWYDLDKGKRNKVLKWLNENHV